MSKFFLDFEATRFADRIISIGCISEYGDEFYSLVKPHKKKVDIFITDLTGITNEMLADAPTSDEAFRSLSIFVQEHSQGQPEYYVYGNSDKVFLEATLKHMNDPIACSMVQALCYAIKDYSAAISNYFKINNAVSLRKAYIFLCDKENNFVQEHNALGDAKMLKETVAALAAVGKPASSADIERLAAIPSQRKRKDKTQNADYKELPDYATSWLQKGASKWNEKTIEVGQMAYYFATGLDHKGKRHSKSFHDLETAAYWAIIFCNGGSPKSISNLNKAKKKIEAACNSKKKVYHCNWTKVGGDDCD